jgi:hypothetical protein
MSTWNEAAHKSLELFIFLKAFMPFFKITCSLSLAFASYNQNYGCSYHMFAHQGETKRFTENIGMHFFLSSKYLTFHTVWTLQKKGKDQFYEAAKLFTWDPSNHVMCHYVLVNKINRNPSLQGSQVVEGRLTINKETNKQFWIVQMLRRKINENHE